MNTFRERRAIRAYQAVHREAIHATEREAAVREPQPPEPCNFCPPQDDVPDRFGELKTVLGRWWWAWLIAFTALCTISWMLSVILVAELVQ